MLDSGNPYVLPAAIVGAVVYLGLTILTDASVFVRVGVLVGIVGVVPVVVNRLVGGRRELTTLADAETADETETGGSEPSVEANETTRGADGDSPNE